MIKLAQLTAPAPSPQAAAFLARAPHGLLIGGECQAPGGTFDRLIRPPVNCLLLSPGAMLRQ